MAFLRMGILRLLHIWPSLPAVHHLHFRARGTHNATRLRRVLITPFIPDRSILDAVLSSSLAVAYNMLWVSHPHLICSCCQRTNAQ